MCNKMAALYYGFVTMKYLNVYIIHDITKVIYLI